MKKLKPKLLGKVAQLQDIPSRKLSRGDAGKVLELLAPGICEIKFCDDESHTYTERALSGIQIFPLENQGDPSRVVA